MASEARVVRALRPLWLTRNGIILAAAIVSGAVAWWMIAWPVATLANTASHKGHFALTFAHMVGGTGMLFLGGLNLYLAARKDHFPLHRSVGKAYLAFGTFGASVAIAITLSSAHKTLGGPILTNATVSLLMLASAWLCFAALGWRAARNRRSPRAAVDDPQLRPRLVVRLLPHRHAGFEHQRARWRRGVHLAVVGRPADRLRDGAPLGRRRAQAGPVPAGGEVVSGPAHGLRAPSRTASGPPRPAIEQARSARALPLVSYRKLC